MNLNMTTISQLFPSGWKVSSNRRACSRGSEFCASTRVPLKKNNTTAESVDKWLVVGMKPLMVFIDLAVIRMVM